MNGRILCLLSLYQVLSLLPLAAQPAVAPSPERTGTARGEDVGPFNVTNSFETGYRFAAVGGDSSLYRANQNFGNGLRLLGGDFLASSKDGKGPGFDTISLTTRGLGNDPYGSAMLRIEKNGAYRYDMNWRQSDYFNPTLTNGGSDTLKDTRRVMQDHDLLISVRKWAKLKMGYSRNDETGPAVSHYELYIGGLARSVLPIFQETRRDWNEYRLGGQFEVLGFHVSVSHLWDYYKEDTPVTSLIPGQAYGADTAPLFPLPNPTYPVGSPSIATAYGRSEPMHIQTPGWFGNISRQHRLWAMNARITYSKADQNSVYLETETGARAAANATCSNCGAGAAATATTLNLGGARRPFTAGDFSFSLYPTEKLTIVSSTSAQNNNNNGSASMLQVNTAAATKNIFWNYLLHEGRVSSSLDVNYRFTKWLSLNSEYRYTDRWIDNFLTRQGTTNSRDLNRLSDHLNAATVGFRLKPVQALTVSLDGTVGRDNGAETPVSPAHYHNLKARVDYRLRQVRLNATYRQVYNLNAPMQTVFTSAYGVPPASYYASHSRDMSATASFPSPGKSWLDLSYTKAHLDTYAALWAELPKTPGSPTIVSVPGYDSVYLSNIHTVSIIARTALRQRGTLYAGYNITRDGGDGRGTQDLGLQDPAAAYLARAQTFPMTYQAPLARLSIRITPRLQWNGGWEFYRYNQRFGYFNYQPYYRAHTGYTSLTWTL